MVLTKYGESSTCIIIKDVLRITDCDENRDARLICFSARFIKSLLFICRWKGGHPEKVVYQVDKFTTVKGDRLKTSTSNSDITDSEVLEVVRMNYDKFYIIILDGGSKYSIFSNIGNCHLFWWIISDYLVILEVVREMKIYNLGLI